MSESQLDTDPDQLTTKQNMGLQTSESINTLRTFVYSQIPVQQRRLQSVSDTSRQANLYATK